MNKLLAPLACAVLIALAGPAAARHHEVGLTKPPSGPAPVPDSPAGGKATPPPPVLPQITSYVLMDAASGAILAEAAPTLQVAPASLVKLMTAHLVFQALHHGALKSDQFVPVSPNAWHADGSRMFIDPTSQVTVDQLLHGMIIDSGNDAAIALAEQVGGSEDAFVQIMVKTGADLGLTDTTYVNATGLPDPALHTTAMDVAKLTRVILADEPEILDISEQQTYTWNKITQNTWNPVLAHDPTVDGLKTGLTNESGHCIDATAIRGGERLIAVVMGGPSWTSSTAAIESLLNYGERNFTEDQLATVGQPIDNLPSSALDTGSVQVGPTSAVALTMPKNTAAKIAHSFNITADLGKGATKGQTLGTATFTLNGNTIATVPVVALADAPPASFLTRMKRKLGFQ